VSFLAAALAWLLDPLHWTGADGIPTRIGEHLFLSAVPVIAAVLVALPLGLYIGHTGRGAIVVVSIANVGRALPSLGIMGIALLFTAGLGLGFGEPALVIALFALAVPPMVTNTFAGLRAVDRDLVEAGRGMGMRELQLLGGVELPLAMPVILAGVRIAAVQVVATASLGAVIATGGLGRYIIDGIAKRDYPQVFVGAVLTAVLSVATELAFAGLPRVATSPGLQRARTPA
jgi:osmoprotectant transport system permease protein